MSFKRENFHSKVKLFYTTTNSGEFSRKFRPRIGFRSHFAAHRDLMKEFDGMTSAICLLSTLKNDYI